MAVLFMQIKDKVTIFGVEVAIYYYILINSIVVLLQIIHFEITEIINNALAIISIINLLNLIYNILILLVLLIHYVFVCYQIFLNLVLIKELLSVYYFILKIQVVL